MAALNVLLNQTPNDKGTAVTNGVQSREYKTAFSLAAFGNAEDARAFLRRNHESLHDKHGWDNRSEVRDLVRKDTGEVIGAYLRREPKMTEDMAQEALNSSF